MQQRYNIQQLIDKFYQGDNLKFLFFWGHTNKLKEEVGKFCFSQWYELPFVVDNITYKTAEHWMMAHKALLFEDQKSFDKIINADKPGEVKELGRLIMGFDELIWAANRYKIVVNGNIHKFNQHPKFAEYLVNTNDRILVEASPVDTIWGIGLAQDSEYSNEPDNWRGQNLLGFALMEVRDFLMQHGHFNNIQPEVYPPWKVRSKIDSRDLFWRMGAGDTHIGRFIEYYDKLSTKEKIILKLCYPTPLNWQDFYGDEIK